MVTPHVRMDKSKTFSTVHGDRAPGDPHRDIHFFQDQLPFDAHGMLVEGYFDDQNDKGGKLRALIERRLKKLSTKPAVEVADIGGDDDDYEDDGEVSTAPERDDPNEVNLESWLRGEAQYQFYAIRAAIQKRYSVVVKDQRAAIEALVLDERIVPEGEIASRFKNLLPD